MKKKNFTFAFLLLAVVLTAVGVSGTYARYTTSDEGTATADVAKWAVKFKDGSTELSDNFELALKQENNTYVVKEKIAPAASVYKDLVVDLTGTEVATDITAELGEISGIEGDASRFTLKLSEVVNGTATELTPKDGVYTINVNLDSGRAALEKSTVTFRVELVWDNDEDQNENDTSMGETAGEITAALTLTAKQHIAADD